VSHLCVNTLPASWQSDRLLSLGFSRNVDPTENFARFFEEISANLKQMEKN